jgi:predicted ferric reductase
VSEAAWYLARSSGIVALGLLLCAMAWGLFVSTKLGRRFVAARGLLGAHRLLAGLAVAFTAVHVLALFADNYVGFGVLDVLVPFASSWEPTAVALGVVAMYILLAIWLTSLAIRRVPKAWWRATHSLAFVLFWVAALHGLLAGTDAEAAWFRLPLLGALALMGLTAVRIVQVVAAEDAAPRRGPASRGGGSGPGGTAKDEPLGLGSAPGSAG